MESNPASRAQDLGSCAGPGALNGPALGLMFSCHVLKVLLIFEPRVSHFCFALGPTHAAVGPVWNPEQSAEVLFPPDSSRTAVPVSGFAFDCNVMLFLTGESSQLSLTGPLMMLCQGPSASPGGKWLRPGSKLNSGVNYKGPSLQKDETLLASARLAAGPKEHSCRVTQVCAENTTTVLLEIRMSLSTEYV